MAIHVIVSFIGSRVFLVVVLLWLFDLPDSWTATISEFHLHPLQVVLVEASVDIPAPDSSARLGLDVDNKRVVQHVVPLDQLRCVLHVDLDELHKEGLVLFVDVFHQRIPPLLEDFAIRTVVHEELNEDVFVKQEASSVHLLLELLEALDLHRYWEFYCLGLRLLRCWTWRSHRWLLRLRWSYCLLSCGCILGRILCLSRVLDQTLQVLDYNIVRGLVKR